MLVFFRRFLGLCDMHINWHQTFDHSILHKFVFEEDPPEIYDCFSETETPACTLFFWWYSSSVHLFFFDIYSHLYYKLYTVFLFLYVLSNSFNHYIKFYWLSFFSLFNCFKNLLQFHFFLVIRHLLILIQVISLPLISNFFK